MTPPPLTLDERLPTPKLDDRRFQDLVDEAKRRVQQRCPEWTDHNVSDPGVTLIETFAWMTDQLLYRLNRVPDLNYVKFLELIGVTLLPPTAASTELTFRLSKAQEDWKYIPVGTEVSTPRSEAVGRSPSRRPRGFRSCRARSRHSSIRAERCTYTTTSRRSSASAIGPSPATPFSSD